MWLLVSGLHPALPELVPSVPALNATSDVQRFGNALNVYPLPSVIVLGCGEGTEHRNVSMMTDFTTSIAAKHSGECTFAMADVTHSDLDVVNLYDAFTFRCRMSNSVWPMDRAATFQPRERDFGARVTRQSRI